MTGYAKFINEHRLQVDDHTVVDAGRIVIATGSTPGVPPPFQHLGERLIINDDIFYWDDLPASIAVFGPGVIGLELGQALSRLGVEVLMFGRGGPVGPLTDPDILASARQSFSAEFYLDADANVSKMEKLDDGVQLEFATASGAIRSQKVDYVIAATGRNPNVRNLGLESTGLPLDSNGIPEFDEETMRIGQSHVFIAGDVTADRPLLHEASDEGFIAGDNAGRYPDVREGHRTSSLGIVFTDPQIAMVGSRFADLDKQEFVTGEVSFEDQGRSRVMLKNQGKLHVYADTASGRFLGAEMIGLRDANAQLEKRQRKAA